MPGRTKTILQLRKELTAGEQALTRLRSRRKAVAAELAGLDKKIALLTGGRAATGRKAKKKLARRKRRRATGTPLVKYLQKVLANARGGLRVKDISAAVTKAGYKSHSKDFYGIVAATLRETKDFKRVKRGVYKLAK